jgi:hypothetical protein
LCGLGGTSGVGCTYGDLRNSSDNNTPMVHMKSGGLQLDATANTQDAMLALNNGNDELFIHSNRVGKFPGGAQYAPQGFSLEYRYSTDPEAALAVFGKNVNSQYGFFATPVTAATSGSNHRSNYVGVAASIWNGSSESPVWAYWDLEPDSNAANATTHAFLYGPCASPITSACAYLSAGLDGLTVTGPATADYWVSTPGTALASAGTIAPVKYITHVTGTTAITTITPPASCGSKACAVVLIPDAANVYNTGGNIANALTATVNVPVVGVYDSTTGKWYLK